jgi:hypothetical protein
MWRLAPPRGMARRCASCRGMSPLAGRRWMSALCAPTPIRMSPLAGRRGMLPLRGNGGSDGAAPPGCAGFQPASPPRSGSLPTPVAASVADIPRHGGSGLEARAPRGGPASPPRSGSLLTSVGAPRRHPPSPQRGDIPRRDAQRQDIPRCPAGATSPLGARASSPHLRGAARPRVPWRRLSADTPATGEAGWKPAHPEAAPHPPLPRRGNIPR